MKDEDLKSLFDITPAYDDEAAFQQRVVMGIRLKAAFRQGLIVVSGFVGGLYALIQFIRIPGWALNSELGGSVRAATRGTDATLEAGVEFADLIASGFADFLQSIGGYIQWMQTPLFFWVSFALCSTILALYLINGSEEIL
ncbi:hypothetical protein [Asticcacaulis machinosus]|uniref:Uncharacterized protein n=1 Tax=Asticcacaulis machinosus TaxID=2984211 RepID=A0ABT5HG33_9CAUL|nr:hypothetical protein [Asticcacaulis machinosus]MDC7674589.1 hypothetical protein [Asticcacaulis machinosus]